MASRRHASSAVGRQRAKGHWGTNRSPSPSLAPKPAHPHPALCRNQNRPQNPPLPAFTSLEVQGAPSWGRGAGGDGGLAFGNGGDAGGLQMAGPGGQEGHGPIVLLSLGFGIQTVLG